MEVQTTYGVIQQVSGNSTAGDRAYMGCITQDEMLVIKGSRRILRLTDSSSYEHVDADGPWPASGMPRSMRGTWGNQLRAQRAETGTVTTI